MINFIKYFKAFYMSLGMFCGIPLPFFIWEEKYISLMVANLPLIGLLIGTLWWLVGLLLLFLGAPLMLTAAIMTITPFFIAGFIHLDGFMDTSDAHLSRRNLEDRLRILKDPNVGAFAVVMLAILFLLQFAAMHTIMENGRHLALFISISVISRCCSAFSIFTLRHMPTSNYIKNINGSYKVIVLFIAVIGFVFSYIYAGIFALIVLAAVVLGFILAIRVVYKSFEGISGDLLGYSLVIGELFGLITLAFLQGRWI